MGLEGARREMGVLLNSWSLVCSVCMCDGVCCVCVNRSG